MKINEYTVHFETLTPLRAGDAWFQNKAPLKASSIMGSLRFWFEVICYFGGITKKEDYTIKIKRENTVIRAAKPTSLVKQKSRSCC